MKANLLYLLLFFIFPAPAAGNVINTATPTVDHSLGSRLSAKPPRLNLKAGFGGSILMTSVASALLEFEAPFLKSADFKWLVQAGAGAAFWTRKSNMGSNRESNMQSKKSKWRADPYVSAHAGLRRNFANWSAALTTGIFYSKLLKFAPVNVLSFGLPMGGWLMEANIGFIDLIQPAYFILSFSAPLTMFLP